MALTPETTLFPQPAGRNIFPTKTSTPKTRRPPLDPATERAVHAFLERVSAEFDVTGAFLYGSRARGKHRFDSDADLTVLLHGETKQFRPTLDALAGTAFDVLLDTEILPKE